MSLFVSLSDEAEGDVKRIYGELEVLRAGLGVRFRLRLGECLCLIEFMPQLSALAHKNARAARIKQFRYVVY